MFGELTIYDHPINYLKALIYLKNISVSDWYSRVFIGWNMYYGRTVLDPKSLSLDSRYWLNMGLWQSEEDTWCEASDRLMARVLEHLDLKQNHRILDVGCGYGESCIQILKHIEARFGSLGADTKVCAFNISQEQLDIVKSRVEGTRFESYIEYICGDAVELDTHGKMFDRILALESTPHFIPKIAFYRNAQKALRKDGKLIATDVIFRKNKPPKLISPLSNFLAALNKNHGDNMLLKEEYQDLLSSLSFSHFSIHDISEQVLPYINKKIREKFFSKDERLFFQKQFSVSKEARLNLMAWRINKALEMIAHHNLGYLILELKKQQAV